MEGFSKRIQGFPLRGCCNLCCCVVYRVTRRRGMRFPGVQLILGNHLHPHEYLKIWLWHRWLVCVPLCEAVHNRSTLLPLSFPLPQTDTGCLSDLFTSKTHAKGRLCRLHSSATVWDFTITFH